MVNYACGFNQSETGKYFEWIIINFTTFLLQPLTGVVSSKSAWKWQEKNIPKKSNEAV